LANVEETRSPSGGVRAAWPFGRSVAAVTVSCGSGIVCRGGQCSRDGGYRRGPLKFLQFPAGMRFSALFVFLFLLSSPCGPSFSDIPTGFIDEDMDFEELLADLPSGFDVETASAVELLALPFFGEDDARCVVAYRKALPEGEDLYRHLDDIPGLSPLQREILKRAGAACEVSTHSRVPVSLRTGYARRPDEESFQDGKYYFRLMSSPGESPGFTVLGERDPGEPQALDFYSASLVFKAYRGRITVLVGDYRPGYGQGLLFSRYGRSYVYGADVDAGEGGRMVSTSFEETRHLRGCHVKFDGKWFDAEAWTSFRALDATIDDGNAVTIRESGHHPPGSPKGNLKERISGARFEMRGLPSVKLAAAGAVSDYSPPLAAYPRERHLNDPEGASFRYLSFEGRYERGSTLLFWEHVLMNTGEKATAGGVGIEKGRVKGGVVLRRYDDGYWAPRSGAFSAFGAASNEEGVYAAVETAVTARTSLIASLDLARTLSRTYEVGVPFSRRRLYVSAEYRLPRGVKGGLSFRRTDDSVKDDARGNARLRLGKGLGRGDHVGWRADLAWSEGGGRGGPFSGFALYLRHGKSAFDLSAGVFDIPSYGARMYYYEKNVPGRGRTAALWGEGVVVDLVLRRGALSVRYLHRRSDMMKRVNDVVVQLDTVF